MKCDFCDINNFKDRIIHKCEKNGDIQWYVFVPQEPQIFGHIILTLNNPHVEDITSGEKQIQEVLSKLSGGISYIADLLGKIDNVKKVYLAMLGETPNIHMHYHMFPRYEFANEEEREYWSKRNTLQVGEIEWRKFYSKPTKGFNSLKGFQYLGDIEKFYNRSKESIGVKPSSQFLTKMTSRINEYKKN